MSDNRNPVLEQVKERLGSLQVYLGQSRDGTFTAYSLSETLFCFDGTLDEVDARVNDTLRSYAKIFYDLDIVVRPRDPASHLPVETLQPIDRFVPEFDEAA